MSDFLYPFLSGETTDRAALVDDLVRSARAKATESDELRRRTLAEVAGDLDAAADAMSARFESGGRLLTIGNGGSSTDAASLASLFADPPIGAGFAAHSLADDPAVLTALANDVGYELVFARQLIALGRGEDIVAGLSTSGNSANLLAAFGHAHRHGMLTIGFAGSGGGAMAESGDVDHLFVVRSDSVHRVQETQDALGFELWRRVADRASRP